ncbi:hypothetical protein [Raoultibacter phocaeensis]|uniref:hypothetical protein n=1 Tax=Raoultibacter phocaeensis TaxID=2479841 RepID=UPI0011188BED|nr:hypothetical protein [Raoultibacter phocaeensis]
MIGRATTGSGLFGSGFTRHAVRARIAAALLVVIALGASTFLFVPKAFAPELTTEPAVPTAVCSAPRS